MAQPTWAVSAPATGTGLPVAATVAETPPDSQEPDEVQRAPGVHFGLCGVADEQRRRAGGHGQSFKVKVNSPPTASCRSSGSVGSSVQSVNDRLPCLRSGEVGPDVMCLGAVVNLDVGYTASEVRGQFFGESYDIPSVRDVGPTAYGGRPPPVPCAWALATSGRRSVAEPRAGSRG
ncbi:hypothetical protein TNCT6_79440 [Streptomyces sp. 6-11-2]|nr:hypothetical protein TNCT6_79440 [Streptomyces sp. 6-11-2]